MSGAEDKRVLTRPRHMLLGYFVPGVMTGWALGVFTALVLHWRLH